MSQEKTGRGVADNLAEWAAPAILLVTPLVIFFRHQQYLLSGTEALICFGIFAVIGLVLAALGVASGDFVRVPMLAGLVVFFADVQFTDLNLGRLGWYFLAALAVATLLRRQLAKIVCLVFGTILLTSLAFPVSDTSHRTFEVDDLPPPSSALPPVVHLILDELIGVEGLPREVDPDRVEANWLRDFFIDRGFDVYGKAYSVTMNTRLSIGTAFDFTVDPAVVQGRLPRARFKKRLAETEYFNELVRRGYQIHVYQTDQLGFCRDWQNAPLPGVQSCFTYVLEHPALISSSPMPILNKVALMLGMYSRLSHGLNALRDRYLALQAGPVGKRFGLPQIKKAPRLSPIAVMPVFDRLARDLAEIEPGHAYLAHLLLPHYSYAYRRDCSVRPEPSQWLTPVFARGNNTGRRKVRYEHYLEQVHCTLERLAQVLDAMHETDRLRGAHVIIHGDHGSRISLGGFFSRGPPSNILDKHSSLFAFHRAGSSGKGSYSLERAPINVLLPEVLGVDGSGLASWSGVTEIFLNNRAFAPLPDFVNGEVIDRGAGEQTR